MSNVSSVIKSIQDIMRKDVGVDGDAQRISQLVWMFFLSAVLPLGEPVLPSRGEAIAYTRGNEFR